MQWRFLGFFLLLHGLFGRCGSGLTGEPFAVTPGAVLVRDGGSDVIHRFKRDCQCSYFNCVSTSLVSIPAICWSLLFPDFSYSKTQAGFTFARIRRCQLKIFYVGILH